MSRVSEGSAPQSAPQAAFGRSTPVGSTLVDTLNVLVAERAMTASAARKVLSSFDQVFPTALQDSDRMLLLEGDKKRRRLVEQEVELRGVVSNYTRFYDYWKIDATDVEFCTGDKLRKIDHVRLLFTQSNS